MRSVVKEINGHMVGLVGYITPHTKFISNSGKVVIVMVMVIFNGNMMIMAKISSDMINDLFLQETLVGFIR